MSVPILCSKCGEVVGVTQPSLFGRWPGKVRCPGRGKHLKPVRKESIEFFGWLKSFGQWYPETSTFSSWREYCGPRDRVALWLVIHLGSPKSVLVDNEWVFPDGWFGLIGEGLEKLNAQAS